MLTLNRESTVEVSLPKAPWMAAKAEESRVRAAVTTATEEESALRTTPAWASRDGIRFAGDAQSGKRDGIGRLADGIHQARGAQGVQAGSVGRQTRLQGLDADRVTRDAHRIAHSQGIQSFAIVQRFGGHHLEGGLLRRITADLAGIAESAARRQRRLQGIGAAGHALGNKASRIPHDGRTQRLLAQDLRGQGAGIRLGGFAHLRAIGLGLRQRLGVAIQPLLERRTRWGIGYHRLAHGFVGSGIVVLLLPQRGPRRSIRCTFGFELDQRHRLRVAIRLEPGDGIAQAIHRFHQRDQPLHGTAHLGGIRPTRTVCAKRRSQTLAGSRFRTIVVANAQIQGIAPQHGIRDGVHGTQNRAEQAVLWRQILLLAPQRGGGAGRSVQGEGRLDGGGVSRDAILGGHHPLVGKGGRIGFQPSRQQSHGDKFCFGHVHSERNRFHCAFRCRRAFRLRAPSLPDGGWFRAFARRR
jgi:hypothetical protein